MINFNWFCPNNSKQKTIDVWVEGPVNKKMIKKLKKNNPGCKIRINGRKY